MTQLCCSPVLQEATASLTKLICWWRLRKRSPCKFLNSRKLCQETLKCLTGQKGSKVSKMPQQSWNKILIESYWNWRCKNRVAGWVMLTMVSSSDKLCDNTALHRPRALPAAPLLSRCWQRVCSAAFRCRCLAPEPKRGTGRATG